MRFRSVSLLAASGVALLLCVPACGGSGGRPDSGGGSETAASGASTGEVSTTTPTTGAGSMSDSMTTAPTSATPGTDGEATMGPGATGETTLDVSTDTGTTGGALETTGTSGEATTGEPCVPTPEVCNDLDDDCDDIVDDIDVGGDGICDCLSIALFGTKGGNPAAEFETWLEAQGTAVERIQLDDTPLTSEIVDKYDIIILDRLVRTYSADEASLMQDWVGGGGGLMAMTGYTGQPPDVTHPNTLIGPMGLTFNDSKGIFNGPVTQWTPHPVSNEITSVTFLGGFYIDVAEDGVGQNTIVAGLPEGPVAVAQVRMAGKLFIWGDEWSEYDSEWQNIPQIKQLWANILGYLSPAKFCTVPQ